METVLILLAFIVLIMLLWCATTQVEKFSSSGFAISNEDCNLLADAYWRPSINDPKVREMARQNICDTLRRHTIHRPTGNYYTVDGVLF